MKLLLFMPTYKIGKHDAAWPDSLDSFRALEAPADVEVVRAIGRDNPYKGEGHRNTLHQFQKARERALAEGFDALVTFEHDMVVPADGLVKLWATPALVVYGLYVLRHGSGMLNAMRHIDGSPNIDQSLSLFPGLRKESERRGWVQVSGVGFGFTLIRREALARFEFHKTEESWPPDWGFAADCAKAGIRQVCRWDVKCGHIEENGVILWPGSAGPVTKVRVMETFYRGKKFTAGTVDEMPIDDALEMSRCGYVRMHEQPGDGEKQMARPRCA